MASASIICFADVWFFFPNGITFIHSGKNTYAEMLKTKCFPLFLLIEITCLMREIT